MKTIHWGKYSQFVYRNKKGDLLGRPLINSSELLGLTWVCASYAVYFSLSYSLEEYSQSQDRIHRIGQKDKCTYIHLAMDNTIDIAVSRSLQGKQAVATMAYQSIKEQS
jgi:SNF2 family DNA or RNA helicase